MVRKHSIFGDYLVGDVSTTKQQIIANHNILWGMYVKSISGRWGLKSIPTKKGFEKWLQKRMSEETINGK